MWHSWSLTLDSLGREGDGDSQSCSSTGVQQRSSRPSWCYRVHHFLFCQPLPTTSSSSFIEYRLRDLNVGGFHQYGDPCLQFRPVYQGLPTQQPNPPPMQQQLYRPPRPSTGNYYIGHVVSGSPHCQRHQHPSYGAPLSRSRADHEKNWGCAHGHVQHMSRNLRS